MDRGNWGAFLHLDFISLFACGGPRSCDPQGTSGVQSGSPIIAPGVWNLLPQVLIPICRGS